MDWLNSVKIPNGVSKKVPSFDLGKVLKAVSYHVAHIKAMDCVVLCLVIEYFFYLFLFPESFSCLM